VVAGGSLRSRRAVMNLRVLCAHHLPECEVEVADLHHAPVMADAHGVVAVPTLLRLAPLPVRRVVGDLADTQAVLRGLGLVPPPPDAPPDAAPPVAGR
jgi:circadian clock protein KaiB